MTFRDFLNAAYALLVEAYLSMGPQRVDLLTAIDNVEKTWKKVVTPEESATRRQAVPTQTARGNDQAVLQLQALMAGVKK